MTAIRERQRARSYVYKKQKKIENLFYTSKTISVMFLYTKFRRLNDTRFFMILLKLAFIYKKHDTLRYVAFLYTKNMTLQYIQKCEHFFKGDFQYIFLKWAEMGEHLYEKNNALCKLPSAVQTRSPESTRVYFLDPRFCVFYEHKTRKTKTEQ